MRKLSDELVKHRESVLATIARDFHGVTREGGVSWSQASVIGDRGSEQAQREARLLDRDEAWAEVAADPTWDLHAGYGGFSFLDAVGFRYYIPAALSKCLRGEGNEIESTLLTLGPEGDRFREWDLEKWSKLSKAQCRSIARFLVFMRDASENSFDAGYWQRALDSHWGQFLQGS